MAGAGTLMGSPDTVLAMLLLVLLHSTALVTATTTQAFTTTGPGYSETLRTFCQEIILELS